MIKVLFHEKSIFNKKSCGVTQKQIEPAQEAPTSGVSAKFALNSILNSGPPRERIPLLRS